MMTASVTIRRRRPQAGLARRQRGWLGFTLVELMVSVTIMVLALLAVGKIFKMSSDASGLVIAHAEALERLETIARVIEADLRSIRPGLLIIDSPGSLRTTDIEDPTGAVQGLFDTAVPPVRFRSDGLAFFSSGGPNLHQSHWSSPPAASGEGILFYGHSWPGSDIDPTLLASGPAADWRLCRRATLTLVSDPGGWASSNNRPVDVSNLRKINHFLGGNPLFFGRIRTCQTDALIDAAADAQDRLWPQIQQKVNSARPGALMIPWNWNPGGAIRAMFGRSELPDKFSVSADASNPDQTDYRRGGALLAEHVGDFIVEWTDGNGSPLNWFGAHRDVDGDNIADVRRSVGLRAYEYQEVTSKALGQPYRAIWNATTWDRRPKALRITVRLYDGNRRLRESVGLKDGAVPANAFTVTRYGQEHQVIIPIP